MFFRNQVNLTSCKLTPTFCGVVTTRDRATIRQKGEQAGTKLLLPMMGLLLLVFALLLVPAFHELKIVECEPAVQGDTSKAGNKPATVETGYVVQVPLFVSNGETIRIDTRTGEYMERA